MKVFLRCAGVRHMWTIIGAVSQLDGKVCEVGKWGEEWERERERLNKREIQSDQEGEITF